MPKVGIYNVDAVRLSIKEIIYQSTISCAKHHSLGLKWDLAEQHYKLQLCIYSFYKSLRGLFLHITLCPLFTLIPP